MLKLDLKKDLKHLYSPRAGRMELVDVPAFRFAMVDGRIEPGEEPGTSPAFAEAIGALYGVCYTLKFLCKLRDEDPVDFPVMPLEGLWSLADADLDLSRKDNWEWTLMILQPDVVTDALFADAVDRARRKRPLPSLSGVRLETFQEGLCVQTMHLGPYADEPATVERMRAFAREQGYSLGGRHHEIYLGDPRRADAARLKTILRHPVERAPA